VTLRLGEEVVAVGRSYPHTRGAPAAHERHRDLGPGGSAPPDRAEQVGQVSDRVPRDLKDNIAKPYTGAMRRAALREPADYEVALHRCRVHAEPRARGARRPAELLTRDYPVDLGAYFGRAWDLFRSNAGILMGASVLVYLVLMGLNLIPYLSIILSLMLTGPLFGGLWSFYVKRVRGEDAGIADAFGGFGPRFVPDLGLNLGSSLGFRAALFDEALGCLIDIGPIKIRRCHRPRRDGIRYRLLIRAERLSDAGL